MRKRIQNKIEELGEAAQGWFEPSRRSRLFGYTHTCLHLAWSNLLQHRGRNFVAALGITVSIILIFIQVGFLQAAREKSTLLYEYFDFDLAVVSQKYQFLISSPEFDRIRLTQAKVAKEVKDTFSLNIKQSRWVAKDTQYRSSLILIGIDDKPHFIKNEKLRRGLRQLAGSRSVLIDAFSHEDYGDIRPGTTAAIREQAVDIVGEFELGLFFYSEGSAVMKNGIFTRYAQRPSRMTTIGLIQLVDGAKPEEVKRQVAQNFPPDVRVMTREELISNEQRYYITVKPTGIIFDAGVIIGFFVGAIIMFQVLSTEISNRIKEYATLKAMGFGPGFIYGIGILQTLAFAILSFLPAALLSFFVFRQVATDTHLEVDMNAGLIGFVFAIVLLMGVMSALISLHRIRRANPAELF